MSSMTPHAKSLRESFNAPFDEAHWLSEQQRRGRRLYGWVEAWLGERRLPEPIASRVLKRALPGKDGCFDGVATFAICAAESLAVTEALTRDLGIASALFWAAADVADDLDDGEFEPSDRPYANDACVLLFLALEQLRLVGPSYLQLGLAAGLRMGAGQAMDLASTGRVCDADPLVIAREKAGAEFAFFLSLAAEAAGKPHAAFIRLGDALGVALQIFSDVADLYMSPRSLDLVSAKHTLILARYAEKAPAEAETFLAAERTWPDLQAHMRYVMKDAARAALGGLGAPVITAWNEVAPLLADPKPLRQLVDWVLGLLPVTGGALKALAEPSPVVLPDAGVVVQRALRFLATGPFSEQQTWGMFGKDVVEGTLFSTIFVAAATRAAGGAWEGAYDFLLGLRDPDGWRYYPGERAIPVDADDAGLILGYFGDVLPPELRAATVAQLLGGFHDGDSIHTWLVPAEGNIAWDGDDCPATLSNAAWGLLCTGHGADVPLGVWRRLIRHALAGDFTSPFYTDEACRYFVHRCLAEAVLGGVVSEGDGQRARDGFNDGYQACRRWGGSTSDSLMATAFDVLAALAWGIAPRGDLPVYFGSRQSIDGAWDAEPLFTTPWVDYRPKRWGHACLTTSVVVQAMVGLELLCKSSPKS